jgi:quercetin dioxygenase-like cupin family protein
MAYKPSPRPQFEGPAHIPYSAVTHHLWGDEDSGMVADWCYVSTDKIHQLVLGLPPGGAFRHSTDYKTKFAADELYYVLAGEIALANPETGEVHIAREGESLFFRSDTWHHGFNVGTKPVRVLEIVAPPPSQASCGEYAIKQPDLETRRYGQDHLLGNWPMAATEAREANTIQVLREHDYMWRLEGEKQEISIGILVSTEHLTVAKGSLLPGRNTTARRHRGDLSLYVLDGVLNMRLPESDGQRWFELHPGDGFYVPEGVPYQFYNGSDKPANFVFGVAPDYAPPET